MNDYSECVHACQAMQLTAMDVLGDLTSNPDVLNIPVYREFTERVYMAARQAATLARVLGDEQTARFTDDICEKIILKAQF